MTGLRVWGPLPDIPAIPAIYLIACAEQGRSRHAPGEILYLGRSSKMRRRVAYALGAPGGAPHGVQAKLLAFQAEGGVAELLYVPAEDESRLRPLEDSLLTEFRQRHGRLPAWNEKGPTRTLPDDATRRAARTLLDQLEARARGTSA